MEKKSFFVGIVYKLLFILILAAIFAVWTLLNNENIFPIKRVEIEAAYQHINSETLQQTIAPYIKGSFFNLNVKRLKKQILEIPWVYKTNILRDWPDKIIVEIIEQTPTAIWNQTALINSDGVLFTPDKTTFPDNLPALSGPPDQVQEVWQRLNAIDDLLKPLSVWITELHLGDDRQWSMLLSNGIHADLGSTDILKEVQLFVRASNKIIGGDSDKVENIDLRYNNGLAIKWK